MSQIVESHAYRRSEAFAEDVADLVSAAPAQERRTRSLRPARWLINALPLVVALIGVAFAIVPPLG